MACFVLLPLLESPWKRYPCLMSTCSDYVPLIREKNASVVEMLVAQAVVEVLEDAYKPWAKSAARAECWGREKMSAKSAYLEH